MLHKHPVFEYSEMTTEIRQALKSYYEGTDHRAISNDSYTRYPYLFDWEYNEIVNPILDRWFFLSGASWNDGYVIIHWEW